MLEMKTKKVKTVYACGPAWQHEMTGDPMGTKVYPTALALQQDNECWLECGIVELKVTEVRWVAEPDWSEKAESRVDKAERREELDCSFCPPHRMENAGRKAKRGAQKPRGKK